MKKWIWVLVLLWSCTTHQNYVVEGITFHEPEAAQRYLDSLHQEWLGRVEPLPRPLATKGVVIIPSYQYLRDGIERTAGGSVEHKTTLATLADRNWLFVANMIQQRGIFGEVELVRSETADSVSSEVGDYVLWYRFVYGQGTQRFIKRHGQPSFSERFIERSDNPSRSEFQRRELESIEAFILENPA